MNILQIILIIAYLLWSYRIWFVLKWNFKQLFSNQYTENGDELSSYLFSLIILIALIIIHLFISGYLKPLTTPLW